MSKNEVFAENKTAEGRKIAAPRGTLETIERSPVLLLKMSVHAHKEFAAPVHRVLDAWIASGAKDIELFFDAAELASYDSELRSLWTDWVLRNRANIKAIHLFTRSSIVAMGINLARALVGKIMISYAERREFDRAFADAKRAASGGA
ncbi:MAG: hypothetical protein JNK05_18785 [Myxococcales bacterium]|nr:hypothetical protein [Myxococcales bacterium]